MVDTQLGQAAIRRADAVEQETDRETINDNIAHDAAERISDWAVKSGCWSSFLFSVAKREILQAMKDKI